MAASATKWLTDCVISQVLRSLKVELCDIGNGKCTAKVTGSVSAFGEVKRFVALRRVNLPARCKTQDARGRLRELWFDEASKWSSPEPCHKSIQ